MELIAALITLGLICLIIVLCILLFTNKSKRKKGPIIIGFFHPYCSSGGGGEKVLWVAVNCLLNRLTIYTPDLSIVIYTGDCDLSSEAIFEKVKVSVLFTFNNYFLLICIYTLYIIYRHNLKSNSHQK